ncbi:1-deoxy-D-xylulose-5-phosphate synthase [Streptomyces sp. NPDC001941]|uniref:1-deoxy-D-xylulose-5-phosphate synthase n=1 Tax=Streptomyces sp. NPDC001941 TaxID=3154659 RepID=UPI00331F619E
MATIKGLEELKALPPEHLPALAAEIRDFLVEKVCATGGHLGVNLGVVELTLAVHRVFNSPRDVVVFDTGHQSYVHKILTGRQREFDQLRGYRGLSGYPMRAESEHDWVENSHASTALAYADGIAKALRLQRRPSDQSDAQEAGAAGERHVVAVIGDGAMTGGLAWEGLNNLAENPDQPVVVVLNDNGHSYTPTIGGIAYHLKRLREHTPARDISAHKPPTLFDQLGLTYLGPVDGHDIAATEDALRHAAQLGRTVVVHVVTAKGRGYEPAEADDADHMHYVGKLDPATGRPPESAVVPAPKDVPQVPPTKPQAGTPWTALFGQQLIEMATQRPDVVAITAAMMHQVGLKDFAATFPERTFDVGIAEQQAVCSAAGMAMHGLHPVVCLYATFLNRAIDQVLMDVALHGLPVTFVLDRAGITGPDGPSHHGLWDMTLLAIVPGMRVAAPRDAPRLAQALQEALETHDGPTMLRYPKGATGPDIDAVTRIEETDILYRTANLPEDILIVAVGTMAMPALEAARQLASHGIGATVADPRWVLPVHRTITQLAARHTLVITIEDGTRVGGVGAAVAQACADADVSTPVRVFGLPYAFIESGEREPLLEQHKVTAADLTATALHHVRSTAV